MDAPLFLQERYLASLMPLQKSVTPWKVGLGLNRDDVHHHAAEFPSRWQDDQRMWVLGCLYQWSDRDLVCAQTPPQIRPFSQEEFMKTLEHAGPQLTSVLKGDWMGLYR